MCKQLGAVKQRPKGQSVQFTFLRIEPFHWAPHSLSASFDSKMQSPKMVSPEMAMHSPR